MCILCFHFKELVDKDSTQTKLKHTVYQLTPLIALDIPRFKCEHTICHRVKSIIAPEISPRRRLVFFKPKYQATYQVQYCFIDLVFVSLLATACIKKSRNLFCQLGRKRENGIKRNVRERISVVLYSVSWHDSSSVRNVSLHALWS